MNPTKIILGQLIKLLGDNEKMEGNITFKGKKYYLLLEVAE